MFNTAERVAEKEAQIQKLELELSAAQTHAQSLSQYGRGNAQKLDSYYASLLTTNQSQVQRHLAHQPPQSVATWDGDTWKSWDPGKSGEEKIIRIGSLEEQEQPSISIPAYAPFIGANKTIIIQSKGANATQGLALLQSLAVRTAFMLPHQSKYTLLDPAGGGIAFPMRRYLPQVRENSSDIRRDLDQVIADIQRVIETYLDASTMSFELVPREIRVNERFQFVFAADFPNQYDRRAIEALQSIGNTGAAGGVYLFIHQNLDYELPHDMNMAGFKNAFYVDLTSTSTSVKGLKLRPDSAPPAQVQNQIFEALRVAKPPERTLDWDSIVGLPQENWWRASTAQSVETPIGLRSGGEALNIWFGVKHEQPCAHGMLGAMTGSGKSNLYHVLICGLAQRYSPAELHLYLIDGKDGVEFQPYRHLPHAAVVSLRSSAELSRSILSELINEKERRNATFSKVGVKDLTAYYEKGKPQGNFPRILLLIDEYQELFDGDRDGVASSYLLQLAQQGRSAGIHMLLASQRFGAPGMLYQPAIFGNVHLRLAMHMTDTDVQALSEFGRRGKALISTCDLPGKIVVNDKSGDDAANQVGKVAYLRGERQNQVLQALADNARKLPQVQSPKTVVFDGQAQPDLFENPYFIKLLQQQIWPTDQHMEAHARMSAQVGGLEVVDWFAAEHPRVAWLGQEFNVRGQAQLILRRRTSENLLVVGGANAARYGMLVATLTGLSASGNPTNTQFIVVDRCIPNSLWSEALRTVCDSMLLPAGFSTYFSNDTSIVNQVLNDLIVELTRRQQMHEEQVIHLPSIFVIMTELDRVEVLRRKADAYGLTDSPSGEKLRLLLVEGPSAGIHLILSFSGVRPMTHVLDDRNSLVHFRHRVALQMSEDESFALVRSRKAAQLQIEGPTPICALYLDMENDKAVRFKPYTVEKNAGTQQESIVEQTQRVGKILAHRRHTP